MIPAASAAAPLAHAPQPVQRCECCDEPKSAFNGIKTTFGFVCYQCVLWIHAVADQTFQLRDRLDRQALLDEIDETP